MCLNGQENQQECRRKLLLQRFLFLLKSLKNGKKGHNNQLFTRQKLLLKHTGDHLPSFFYPKYQGIFNLFRTSEEKQLNRLVLHLFLLLEKYSKNKLG